MRGRPASCHRPGINFHLIFRKWRRRIGPIVYLSGILRGFYAMLHNAERVICYGPAVCPSVRLSHGYRSVKNG